MTQNYEWLDRIVAAQAAYYGLDVEQFTHAMSELADAQELVEMEGEPGEWK